ncbi:zinc finger protein ZAT5-like [Typha angustifolia]|uniref:zinc finger protein ZAT5-like n=1 Tax=Typha angustifolia TaxID=59011 RepID=UPI003C2ED531
METIVKGKRTKRQRIHSPPAPVVGDSSSGSSADREASMNATEEEEDMANCLILLAQGGGGAGGLDVEMKPEEDKNRSKRIGDQSAGNYVYECKTCSKCFGSFQALGGHRASHKKPRLTPAAEDRKVEIGEDVLQINMNSFSRSINGGGMIKSRVHECSICGSEFNSGQALGGHMRRHRPLVVVAENQEVVIKKERSLLELDLNLPAPSSDDERGELQSPPSPPAFELPLLFSASASALVDCHY